VIASLALHRREAQPNIAVSDLSDAPTCSFQPAVSTIIKLIGSGMHVHQRPPGGHAGGRCVWTRQMAALFVVKWRHGIGHRLESVTFRDSVSRRTILFLSNFILIRLKRRRLGLLWRASPKQEQEKEEEQQD